MTAIETRGLPKRYGDVRAVRDLNLVVEEAEAFGFLGPNGAGKTTTIGILLDFIRPSAGHASVCGYDAQDETDEVRARVGILPDGFDLWERSTGYRHLEFALEARGGGQDPDHLLDRVGLYRTAGERAVGDYSKGMKQRLAMAMALADDPELLILDEPSSGLDPHGIRRMREIIREEVHAGTTVFFSSHILGEVAAVCERIAILDAGELVATDTLEGLRDRAGAGHDIVLEVGAAPTEGLDQIEGVVDVRQNGSVLRAGYVEPAAKARIVHHVVDSGVTDRTPEEIVLAAARWAIVEITSAYGGICPRCSATIDDDLHVCADHATGDGRCDACNRRYGTLFEGACTTCPFERQVILGGVLIANLAVRRFLSDHGLNPVYPSSRRYREAMNDFEEEIRSMDPLEVHFTYTVGDDALRVTFDERFGVVEVEERTRGA